MWVEFALFCNGACSQFQVDERVGVRSERSIDFYKIPTLICCWNRCGTLSPDAEVQETVVVSDFAHIRNSPQGVLANHGGGGAYDSFLKYLWLLFFRDSEKGGTQIRVYSYAKQAKLCSDDAQVSSPSSRS